MFARKRAKRVVTHRSIARDIFDCAGRLPKHALLLLSSTNLVSVSLLARSRFKDPCILCFRLNKIKEHMS
jgi:hypothetical protein